MDEVRLTCARCEFCYAGPHPVRGASQCDKCDEYVFRTGLIRRFINWLRR